MSIFRYFVHATSQEKCFGEKRVGGQYPTPPFSTCRLKYIYVCVCGPQAPYGCGESRG